MERIHNILNFSCLKTKLSIRADQRRKTVYFSIYLHITATIALIIYSKSTIEHVNLEKFTININKAENILILCVCSFIDFFYKSKLLSKS